MTAREDQVTLFLDRHDLGRRTLLVHIDQRQSDLATSAELAELASSAGLEICSFSFVLGKDLGNVL